MNLQKNKKMIWQYIKKNFITKSFKNATSIYYILKLMHKALNYMTIVSKPVF